MTNVYVQCHEAWNDDDCSFEVLGVVLDPAQRWELETCWVKDVTSGDDVWVLWVEYTTGDSVSQYTDQGEIIATFTSQERAAAAQAEWNNSRQAGTVCFMDDGGDMMYLQNPAADYFSAITDVHIRKFTVDDCPPSKYN